MPTNRVARTSGIGATIITSAALLLSCTVLAQPPESRRASGPSQHPPMHYGPWNRDLLLLESNDGVEFHRIGTFVERGGVASLAAKPNGELVAVFQWFPLDDRSVFDRIAVMVSRDDGRTWSEPAPIILEGLPKFLNRAFDPSLVLLDDGTFRLYFTSERGDVHGRRGNRAIFSARSRDGSHYTVEPGVRFAVAEQETYDGTVAKLGNVWHLYCPHGPGRGYHATSEDGLAFTQQEDVVIPVDGQWLGAVLAVPGGLWFYGTGAGGWRASSPDGFKWMINPNVRFEGADPGVALTDDGRTLMIATGDLRPDATPGESF